MLHYHSLSDLIPSLVHKSTKINPSYPNHAAMLYARFECQLVVCNVCNPAIQSIQRNHPNLQPKQPRTSNALNSNIPRPPPPPRPRPQPHSDPTRHRHRPERTPIALRPVAHLVLVPAHDLRPLHAGLVDARIDGAPDGGAGGRDDGHDAPVRAEVVHAPDDGDDDGAEGEDGAVAEADEGGDEGEEGRVRLRGCGGEEELAEGEEEGAG